MKGTIEKQKERRGEATASDCRLLTVKEVAELVGVRESTIYTWFSPSYRAQHGAKFRYYKIGNQLRFRLGDVLTWIEAHGKEK